MAEDTGLDQFLGGAGLLSAGTHQGDLLDALLSESCGAQGDFAGLQAGATVGVLSQADELEILSILGSSDGQGSSPDSHCSLYSAHSPQSTVCATHGGLGDGSPLSSMGSAGGHEADVSSASSPESFIAASPIDSLDTAVLNMDSTSVATWPSLGGDTSWHSLLTGTSLSLCAPSSSSSSSVITEQQLMSLQSSLELPLPNTTHVPACSRAAMDFSTLAMATCRTDSLLAAPTATMAMNTAQSCSAHVALDLPLSDAVPAGSDLTGNSRNSSGEQEAAGLKRERLYLTAEEKRLLQAEDVDLPQYLPLTKNEEKHLKRVQRKIKNKISALDSRKKKKEYVDGLETRVQSTTVENRRLHKRVQTLEDSNQNLMSHLKKLQDIVMAIYPTTRPVHTGIAVFVLSFALFLMPGYLSSPAPTAMEVSMAYVGGKVRTRVLMAPDVSAGFVLPQSEMHPPPEDPLHIDDSKRHDPGVEHSIYGDRRRHGDEEGRLENGPFGSDSIDAMLTKSESVGSEKPGGDTRSLPLSAEQVAANSGDVWQAGVADVSNPARDEI